MCLAIPGRILAIDHEGPGDHGHGSRAADPSEAQLWRMATVDFGGVRQRVSLACLPEAQAGDAVLVHVGLAISLVAPDC